MSEVPETTLHEINVSRKRAVRITSEGPGDIVPCAEGELLKQQYDSTLGEWRKQSQPPARLVKEGEALARQALQLREQALIKRNAAANRMYLHRATCAICRRRR